jgi:hypothetical protein
MEKSHQPSLLTHAGSPDGGVISENIRHDLENTFQTLEQIARAKDIILSGEAKSAKEALQIMSKEDSENPVNDAHQK